MPVTVIAMAARPERSIPGTTTWHARAAPRPGPWPDWLIMGIASHRRAADAAHPHRPPGPGCLHRDPAPCTIKCSADVLAPGCAARWDAAKVEAEARLPLAHHRATCSPPTCWGHPGQQHGVLRRSCAGGFSLNVPMLWRALCYRQRALDIIANNLFRACVQRTRCTS